MAVVETPLRVPLKTFPLFTKFMVYHLEQKAPFTSDHFQKGIWATRQMCQLLETVSIREVWCKTKILWQPLWGSLLLFLPVVLPCCSRPSWDQKGQVWNDTVQCHACTLEVFKDLRGSKHCSIPVNQVPHPWTRHTHPSLQCPFRGNRKFQVS